MSQLTRLSQALIDEPLAPRTNVEDLRTRSRRRHQRSRSIMAGLLVLIVIGAFSFTKIESTSPSFQTLPKITTPNVQLASYFRAAGAVPDATLQAVGLPSNVAVPTKITPSVPPLPLTESSPTLAANTARTARFSDGRCWWRCPSSDRSPT